MYFELKKKYEIKKYYNSYGYVIIKNFFKKKNINTIKKKIVHNIKKKKNKFFYYEKISKNKKKLRRIEKITDYSKEAKKIIYSKEILNFINFLNNKKNVIFKDKLNFKYPGGEGYLPHIDGHFYWKKKDSKIQNGWKLYANTFTNFVIPLEKSNIDNGCLYVSNKNNTKILGNNWKKITDNLIKNTPNIKKKYLNKFKFKPAILDQGDILFFDWKCAHKSKKNYSNKSRMIFYATFCSNEKKIRNVRNKYYLDKLKSKNSIKFKSLQFN